jgi:hypothetical protein
VRAPLDLEAVFVATRDLLETARVPHAFIGALPAIAWGRIRTTTDVDVVALVDAAAMRGIDAGLKSLGYRRGRDTSPADPQDPLPDMATYWSPHETSVRLDFFIAKTPFEQEVIGRARRATVLGVEATVAPPEASIIYKLIAHRGRDIEDVQNIFDNRRAAGEALDWEFLDRWAREWQVEDGLAPYREKYRSG